LIDPQSIEELKIALETLQHDEVLRKAMAKSALLRAKHLSLTERAERIVTFMEKYR
jgi:hypothetical protein